MSPALDFLRDMIGARPLEIAAFFLGLVNIVLIVRRSVWNYPFGIVMVALYAQVFFDAKLYSDAGLQIFFFAVQFYGWAHWLTRRDKDGLVIVARISARSAAIYATAGLVGVAMLGTFMARHTDASYPWWDAAIAVMSVIAQILLARRMLENWLIWIAVDALAIGLFHAKGLYPTAVLYGLFLIIAALGYVGWRNAWTKAGAQA